MKKMKTNRSLAILIFAAGFFACNNADVAPEKVKTAFKEKFHDATQVKWSKEEANEWEAGFMLNGQTYSASFTTEGVWKETEYATDEKTLPAVILSSIGTNFPGYEIEEAEVSETTEGIFYEVEVEKDETSIEIKYDKQGNIISQQQEKDEKGDRDKNKEDDKD